MARFYEQNKPFLIFAIGADGRLVARASIPPTLLPSGSTATAEGWIANAVTDLKSTPQIAVIHEHKKEGGGTFAHMKPVEMISDIDTVTLVKRLVELANRYGQSSFSA